MIYKSYQSYLVSNIQVRANKYISKNVIHGRLKSVVEFNQIDGSEKFLKLIYIFLIKIIGILFQRLCWHKLRKFLFRNVIHRLSNSIKSMALKCFENLSFFVKKKILVFCFQKNILFSNWEKRLQTLDFQFWIWDHLEQFIWTVKGQNSFETKYFFKLITGGFNQI